MKKLLTLALVIILALSLLTACKVTVDTPSGDNSTPAGDNTPDTGELTLDALKTAAKDAGYVTDNSMASTNNFEGTLVRPVRGFCIEVTKANGDKSLAISVNEFESAEDVQEYAGYILGREYSNDVVYTSGKFCLEFVGPDEQNMGPGIVAAFATVGWVTD